MGVREFPAGSRFATPPAWLTDLANAFTAPHATDPLPIPESLRTSRRSRFWRPSRQIAQNIVSSVRRKAWICGTPLWVESPGLMTGLAGIGCGLLRLAEPARVPSVLLLAPPPVGEPGT